jgi:uncharacterized protein
MKKLFGIMWMSTILMANVNFAKDAPRSAVAIVEDYFRYLQAGNFDGLLSLFHDDIIWHQPGHNSLSKTYHGKQQVIELFQKFMLLSQGSFRIDEVSSVMSNGDLVTAIIRFSASRCQYFEVAMSMAGVDLMKVVDGKIVEVWLFSQDQPQEDAFWG